MNYIFSLFLFFGISACASAGKQVVSAHEHPKLASIYFDVNDATVKDKNLIQQNARWILTHPDQVIVLEGNCDERGDNEFNLHLGDLRSRSVMKALMDEGVPEKQLIVVSYGKKRPLVKVRSADGFAKNRRVDFALR